jgi:hypothetical protein
VIGTNHSILKNKHSFILRLQSQGKSQLFIMPARFERRIVSGCKTTTDQYNKNTSKRTRNAQPDFNWQKLHLPSEKHIFCMKNIGSINLS